MNNVSKIGFIIMIILLGLRIMFASECNTPKCMDCYEFLENKFILSNKLSQSYKYNIAYFCSQNERLALSSMNSIEIDRIKYSVVKLCFYKLPDRFIRLYNLTETDANSLLHVSISVYGKSFSFTSDGQLHLNYEEQQEFDQPIDVIYMGLTDVEEQNFWQDLQELQLIVDSYMNMSDVVNQMLDLLTLNHAHDGDLIKLLNLENLSSNLSLGTNSILSANL